MAPSRTLPGPLAALLLTGCVASTQDLVHPRVVSLALEPATGGALAAHFGPPDRAPSRFTEVDRGDEGLDLRLALAECAEVSLDVQSYLWHEDAVGGLLLDRLLAAADRGVRVRLLIDGFKLEGAEELDAALDLHPNFEVRAFNPALHRSGVLADVELLENLERFDHRMHNKLFVADGVAAVFGGRNVGGEYFGLGEELDLRDLDLLAGGPVVAELGATFDAFWNGEWTLALTDLTAPLPDDHAAVHAAARDVLAGLHAGDARLDGRRALGREGWLAALERATAQLVPGDAEVLFDSAHIEATGATGLMARAFEEVLAEEGGDVLLVTAYLVPGEELLADLRAHAAAGGRVRILTNSLVTTNQPLVHASYRGARRALLEAGVELYELRGDAFGHVHQRSPGSAAPLLGLHAKSAVLGDDLVLVGSMNLDPRSMALNTELGVLVRSPELAARLRAHLERELAPRNAWRVALESDGGMSWTSDEEVRRSEPSPGRWASLRTWLLSFLPVGGEV